MAHRAPILAAVAAGVIVLGGAVGGGIVMAAGNQTPTPTPSTAPNDNHQQQIDDYINKLAANLGIDASKLKDAMKQTALDELDQAVKDGKLTQTQADNIRQRIESGDTYFGLGGFAGHGGKFGPGGRAFGIGGLMGQIDKLATFFNIDTATLRDELGQGESLAQIAEAHGKSRDELKAFLTQSIHDALQQAVTNGKITQDQATAAEERATGNLDDMIDRTFPAKGSGPMWGSPHDAPNGNGNSQGRGRAQPLRPNGASYRIGATS